MVLTALGQHNETTLVVSVISVINDLMLDQQSLLKSSRLSVKIKHSLKGWLYAKTLPGIK